MQIGSDPGPSGTTCYAPTRPEFPWVPATDGPEMTVEARMNLVSAALAAPPDPDYLALLRRRAS